MSLTRTELEQIAADPSIDEGSRQKAKELLDATADNTAEDEKTLLMLADAYRTAHAIGHISNQEFHGHFESARKAFKNSKAFRIEAENEPPKENWIAAWGKNPFTGVTYA